MMNQRVIFITRNDLVALAGALDACIDNPVVLDSNPQKHPEEIIKSIHSLQILRGDGDSWHAIAVVNTRWENARPASAATPLPEKDFTK